MARFLLCRSSRVLLALGWAVSTLSLAAEPTLTERVQQLEAQIQSLLSSRLPTGDELLRRGPFVLRLAGFVQTDAVLYRQDSVDQLDGATGVAAPNQTRFVIRRARLRAEAEATYVGATVEIDGNTVQGTQVRLLGGEAWLQWPQRQGLLPYLRATVGMFKIPFGREVWQYDPERLFLERSQIIRALFPGEYDLVLRLAGGWRFLRYTLAGMNGQPSESRPLRRAIRTRARISSGASASTAGWGRWWSCGPASRWYGEGFSPGSPPSKDVLSFRDDNDDGQVQPQPA